MAGGDEPTPASRSSRSSSPPRPLIIVRTTTATVPWRSHDNDGVDRNLIQSNEVDRVVRSLVQRRQERERERERLPAGDSVGDHQHTPKKRSLLSAEQLNASSSLSRAVSKASWAIFDTYAMTRDLPSAHCHVEDASSNPPRPLKFFADDMHFQPFVSREFNRVLLSMLPASHEGIDQKSGPSILAAHGVGTRTRTDHLLRQLRMSCPVHSAVCEIELQSHSAAAQQLASSHGSACDNLFQHDAERASDSPPPRVTYVLCSSPFHKPADKSHGPVHPQDVLRLHLRALRVLPNTLQRLMIMLPSYSALRGSAWDEDERIDRGYLDIMDDMRRLPFAASVARLPNNTLGSYGMYLAAYAMHRAAYDFYIFCEDDYIPTVAHFDAILLKLYAAAFGPNETRPAAGVRKEEARTGILCGLVQGRPVEPNSPLEVHLESSHVMSSRALAHVMAYAHSLDEKVAQTAATAATGVVTSRTSGSDPGGGSAIDAAQKLLLDRHLAHLHSQPQAGQVHCRTHKTRCQPFAAANRSQLSAGTAAPAAVATHRSVMGNPFDNIQVAFGALMQAAGVEIRDWTAVFRTPYWSHRHIVDWSGAVSNFTVPVERTLFAPVQWLVTDTVQVCCGPTQQSCSGATRSDEVVAACTVERRGLESRAGATGWSNIIGGQALAGEGDDCHCCHEHFVRLTRSTASGLMQRAAANANRHAAFSVHLPLNVVSAWTPPSCMLAGKRDHADRVDKGIQLL